MAIRILPFAVALLIGMAMGAHHPLYMSIYTRRPATARLLPPTLPPPLDMSATASLVHGLHLPPSLPLPRSPVPSILHYVYGLGPRSLQKPFPYYAHLAMRSALTTLKPDKVMFHCVHEPYGYWWDQVRSYDGWAVDTKGQRRGRVEVVKARDVTWVGKERAPVHHVSWGR